MKRKLGLASWVCVPPCSCTFFHHNWILVLFVCMVSITLFLPHVWIFLVLGWKEMYSIYCCFFSLIGMHDVPSIVVHVFPWKLKQALGNWIVTYQLPWPQTYGTIHMHSEDRQLIMEDIYIFSSYIASLFSLRWKLLHIENNLHRTLGFIWWRD